MKLHKYTENQLINAVKISTSMHQVLKKLGVVPYGGNYETLKKALKYFKLNTNHFIGQGWSKGKTFQPKRDIQEYLFNKYTIQSHKLRLRLIKEKIMEHKCSMCGKTKWLNKPIPLELDHIDGNNKNNFLSNLRMLCPNCHAFTPNYRGKKQRKNKLIKIKTKRPNKKCINCKKSIDRKATRCRSCAGKHIQPTKIKWPEAEQLIMMVEQSSYVSVARQLGISDNAIRKRIKQYFK